MIHKLYSNLSATPDKLKKIKEETDKDEFVQLVKKHISGRPIHKHKIPTKIIKYWHIRDELHLIEGLTLKNGQIVIPSSLQNYISQKLHISHL